MFTCKRPAKRRSVVKRIAKFTKHGGKRHCELHRMETKGKRGILCQQTANDLLQGSRSSVTVGLSLVKLQRGDFGWKIAIVSDTKTIRRNAITDYLIEFSFEVTFNANREWSMMT